MPAKSAKSSDFDSSKKVKPTKEKLLRAAQSILEEDGLESLNSNSISERAKVTPPTFYHYFKSKHEVLRELGTRMMHEQTEAVREDTGIGITSADDFKKTCERIIQQSYIRTRNFTGSYALLISLRAIPELTDVRLTSHNEIASLLAEYFREQGLGDDIQNLTLRARLTLEISYAAIELLYETSGADEAEILKLTVDAILKVYDFF